MLYNAFSLFLLLAVSASSDSINSFRRRLPTQKPNVLLEEDSIISKSINPPTHISEFTDPDTGLNPFLDLEEGATFLGRNVMKDEHRDPPSSDDNRPFMDFDMVEGDSSDRRLKIELDFSRKPLEETIPLWIPFEAGHPEVKLEEDEEVTTAPIFTNAVTERISFEPTTVWWSDEDIASNNEIGSEVVEQKTESEMQFSLISNTSIVCISLSSGILMVVLFIAFGIWWRRKRIARTSRLPVANGELKC